jgi:hypothetical protein
MLSASTPRQRTVGSLWAHSIGGGPRETPVTHRFRMSSRVDVTERESSGRWARSRPTTAERSRRRLRERLERGVERLEERIDRRLGHRGREILLRKSRSVSPSSVRSRQPDPDPTNDGYGSWWATERVSPPGITAVGRSYRFPEVGVDER